MTSDTYPRHMLAALHEALADTPVVCLLGPRQVGKSTLVKTLAPGRTYVTLDDHATFVAAQADPAGFIEGQPLPVTLDEIQRVPQLLPAIKMVVDQRRLARKPSAGMFLLTGSANLLLLPAVRESLAGRMEIIPLHPLSEQEKQRSDDSLLQHLLDDRLTTRLSPQQSASTLAEAVCGGGYPEPLLRSGKRAQQWYREYLHSIVQRDVQDVADIRAQDELLTMMEILASRTATLFNASAVANELKLERRTVEKYLAVLERLFLLRRLPPWHRNHAKRLIKTPKIHLVDSGLASALSAVTVAQWQSQAELFGHLLETFVVQQLICQAGWVDRSLRFYHYRDKDQLEVDLVIERGQQVWGVEIKRAATVQSSDASALQRLATQAGKQFRSGMLLYAGKATYPLSHNPPIMAVPLARLWSGL